MIQIMKEVLCFDFGVKIDTLQSASSSHSSWSVACYTSQESATHPFEMQKSNHQKSCINDDKRWRHDSISTACDFKPTTSAGRFLNHLKVFGANERRTRARSFLKRNEDDDVFLPKKE